MVLFASKEMLAAMQMAANPLGDIVRDFSHPLGSRPFMGLPVAKSPLFPYQSKCSECSGSGYPAGGSYCAKCKGTGGYTVLGVMYDPVLPVVQTMFPDGTRSAPCPSGLGTMFVETWEKRFPARFPPSVAVPLRDVSIPIGGR